MTRSFFGRRFEVGGATRLGRDRKARPRRLQPGIDGLERRDLLSVGVGGPINQTGSLVVVTPDPSAPGNTNTVTVSQSGGMVTIDLNAGETDAASASFAAGTILMVEFLGNNIGGTENFTNSTGITSIALGGSGTNNFTAAPGAGMDVFYGGSGTNNFTVDSGYAVLVGGTGTNDYTLNGGSGVIIEKGTSNHVMGSSHGFIVIPPPAVQS